MGRRWVTAAARDGGRRWEAAGDETEGANSLNSLNTISVALYQFSTHVTFIRKFKSHLFFKSLPPAPTCEDFDRVFDVELVALGHLEGVAALRRLVPCMGLKPLHEVRRQKATAPIHGVHPLNVAVDRPLQSSASAEQSGAERCRAVQSGAERGRV